MDARAARCRRRDLPPGAVRAPRRTVHVGPSHLPVRAGLGYRGGRPLGELVGIPANGFAVNTDQWDGYNADRDELVDHLRAAGTKDVVFLTGDIHTSWANELVTRTTGSAGQRCRMDWYHVADRTRANTNARWVAGWSVGTGSSKIRRESAPT